MPPFDSHQLEQLEQVMQAPLTSRFIEHGQLPEGHVNVPDDVRAVALFGLAAALDSQEVDYDALHETQQHLRMVHNLENFILDREAGMSESELFEHQQDVFHDIYKFLINPPLDEAGNYIRKGYIKLPTGTGKTAIFTTLVDILNKPLEEGAPKLKSLVLVPKLDLVSQTVGTSEDGIERGFARFAKDTSVTEYHGQKKDLSGDAVVMTYRSFNILVRAGLLDKDLFDLVVCDEAHNALAQQVRQSLENYCEGKLVIGLTATPDFASNKRVIDFFPSEIHNVELREAIEEGFLAPVQCLAVTSDEEIKTLGRGGGDYTEAELEKLIEHEWRNQKAVEFAKQFISDGKQGLISCVPGQDLAHARLMTEKLQAENIVDPVTGETRKIRAMAVGGHISKEERTAIYQQFENGEIDVLTYVDLLTEGWDSQAAKFLINLRPTTSPVNAVQRMGRILRPGELAIIVEFIDKSDKPQFTFYHALGVEEIELGKIYGPRPSDGEGEPEPRFDTQTLPDDLRELLAAVDHRLIGELVVQPLAHEIPDDIVSLQAFAKSMGVGRKTIEDLLDELGILPDIYLFNKRIEGYGLTQEQQDRVSGHEFFSLPLADDTIKSLFAFCQEYDLGRTTGQKAIEELGLTLGTYRFENGGRRNKGLTEEQQRQVLEHISEQAPLLGETDISLRVFTASNNTSYDLVKTISNELGIEIGLYRIAGHLAPGLTAEQAQAILNHPHFLIADLTNNQILVKDLVSSYRMEHRKLYAVFEAIGVEPQYYRNPETGQRTLAISADQATRFADYLDQHMPLPPEDIVSITEFAKEQGLNPRVVKGLAAEIGIELRDYRFVGTKGARVAPGISTEQMNALVNHPLYQQQVERVAAQAHTPSYASHGATSLYVLAKELSISPQRLNDILAEQSIEPSEYGFGSQNKPALGLIEDQRVALMKHPYLMIPLASEEDISVPQASKMLGLQAVTFRKILEKHEVSLRTMRGKKGQVRVGEYLSNEQLEEIRQLPELNILPAPEGTKSLYALTKELGITEKRIMAFATEVGIEIRDYKVERGHATTTAACLTPEQLALLQTHPFFLIPRASEDLISLSQAAKSIGAATQTLLKAAEAIGVQPRQVRSNSGQVTVGFSKEELTSIDETLKTRRNQS
jgi:superfamily II DNA or RNA helicase